MKGMPLRCTGVWLGWENRHPTTLTLLHCESWPDQIQSDQLKGNLVSAPQRNPHTHPFRTKDKSGALLHEQTNQESSFAATELRILPDAPVCNPPAALKNPFPIRFKCALQLALHSDLPGSHDKTQVYTRFYSTITAAAPKSNTTLALGQVRLA